MIFLKFILSNILGSRHDITGLLSLLTTGGFSESGILAREFIKNLLKFGKHFYHTSFQWNHTLIYVLRVKINNNLIIKSSNENIGNEHVALNKQLQHLHHAQIQRSDYQSKVESVKEIVREAGDNFVLGIEKTPTNSIEITNLYSFWFCSNGTIPKQTLINLVLYSLKLLENVVCFVYLTRLLTDNIHTLLMNPLIVAKVLTQLSVISTTSLKITVLESLTACYLQADNCSGQNKNNTMIRYLCWRVYKKITQ